MDYKKEYEKQLADNKKLRERINELEELLKRKSGSNLRAYNEIRAMIIKKANTEVEADIVNGEERNWSRQRVEKKIMSDLKWDLRVRRVADFRDEHIEQAKEYLKKYEIPDELKKSQWRDGYGFTSSL